jgi:hypothetical protein
LILTKKVRIYIQDKIVPSPSRTVRMVLDILTDTNILKIPVEEENVEDLTIFGVNRDWDIPFLEEEGILEINLGDLDQWIGVPNKNGLKHMKLDIKFVLVEPEFQMNRMNLGYTGFFWV